MDQRLSRGQENSNANSGYQNTRNKLITEGSADTLLIVTAVELRCKNASSGDRTENTQVKHKNQLIDNGNTIHGQLSHLTDHHIVQQGHKIGDCVLDNDGQRNDHCPPVKCPVAYISTKHKYLTTKLLHILTHYSRHL